MKQKKGKDKSTTTLYREERDGEVRKNNRKTRLKNKYIYKKGYKRERGREGREGREGFYTRWSPEFGEVISDMDEWSVGNDVPSPKGLAPGNSQLNQNRPTPNT